MHIKVRGLKSGQFSELAEDLQDRRGLHAQIAADAEILVKARGRVTAAGEHRTALRLGASPTGHLEDAYEAIESSSNSDQATLHVPRASRLRAAFGSYTLEPTGGRKFLTIPAAAESYGKRAREFQGLVFIRSKKTPGNAMLGREIEGGLKILYFLVKRVEMPEDRGLLPFAELEQTARISAQEYVDGKIKEALA